MWTTVPTVALELTFSIRTSWGLIGLPSKGQIACAQEIEATKNSKIIDMGKAEGKFNGIKNVV